MPTNAENMGKIGKVGQRYSSGYADFCPVFCPVVAKIPQTPFIISGVTGPKLN